MSKHYLEAAKKISDISNQYVNNLNIIEILKKGEQRLIEIATQLEQQDK